MPALIPGMKNENLVHIDCCIQGNYNGIVSIASRSKPTPLSLIIPKKTFKKEKRKRKKGNKSENQDRLAMKTEGCNGRD